MLVVSCSLFVACCSFLFSVVRFSLLFAVRFLLFVGCLLLVGVCCLLFVARWLSLLVVLLFVEC